MYVDFCFSKRFSESINRINSIIKQKSVLLNKKYLDTPLL